MSLQSLQRTGLIQPRRRGGGCGASSGSSQRTEPDDTGLRRDGSSKLKLNFRIAHTYPDLRQCFALIYQAYRQAGLSSVNAHAMRVTPHHLLPTTEVIATCHAETIISTVSMFGDGDLGLPSELLYSQEFDELRAGGSRLCEIGSLADRRQSSRGFLKYFIRMMHFVTQMAHRREYDMIVAAVHPKHARLYQRILPFQQIGPLTQHPCVNDKPAVLIGVNFDWELGSPIYQRFFCKMRSDDLIGYKPWTDQARERLSKVTLSPKSKPVAEVLGQDAWDRLTAASAC